MDANQTHRTELMAIWESLGVARSDLVPDRGGTIRPKDPTAASPPVTWDAGSIEMGPVIGAGGMGLVRLGRQSTLRRVVAVKMLSPESASPGAAHALLREAWVTGNLEHPSIVPLYALHGDASAPRLVMRRVEGTVWSALLEDPEACGRLHPGDPLGLHLAVFLQLCQAVHFAHSRGALHLDVKPSNVMVGASSEVYLLDWGLAVALPSVGSGEGISEWLPPATGIRSVCGTPGYMAPEQAAGDGAAIGVATDVYLLGAALHHVFTGGPPHTGADVEATLVAAFESADRSYGPEVPPAMQRILRRALARDPAHRFATAAELRHAVERFLEHRASDRLARRGLETLDRLRAWASSTEPGQGAREAEGQAMFSECRFAFLQARETWADNPEAEAGLQEAVTLMADRAVRARDLTRALALAAELPHADPALRERCEELEVVLGDEASRRLVLRRDLDTGVNRRMRSSLAALTGVAWIGVNLAVGALVRQGTVPLTYALLVGGGVITFALYLGVIYVVRDRLLTTRIDRRLLTMFGSGYVVVTALYTSCQALGVAPLEAVALGAYTYLYFAVATAVFFDARAWIGVALVAPVALLVPFAPAFAFEAAAVMGGSLGLLLAWLWGRRDSKLSKPVRSLPR